MARAGLTPERLTEAAADLADRIGFEQVTVTALARGFGVKDASLYSHVRNAQELRTRVALLAARELGERLRAAVAGRAGHDALVAFADAFRDFALRHPGRYAASQLPLPEEVLVTSPGHTQVVRTIYAVMHAYGLAEPEQTDAVRLLRSALYGYVSLQAAGAFLHQREVQTSWEQGVAALHFTLSNWSAATATATATG
ncbi:TetR-like C-terminal domain-containing protein [Kitasatospora nipponensis]|uniref:TetR-like C-terminal domain-containing protein n=1 Tax=Kitasatospora nipponensis TaxID=258049 RepID=A0ABN1WB96_9ACTN